jgi:hypothetical protein
MRSVYKLTAGLQREYAMGLISRLWAGFVAAVAGVALALVVQIVGQMTIGLPIEYLEKLVLAFGGGGFIIGLLVGNRRIGTPKDNQAK